MTTWTADAVLKLTDADRERLFAGADAETMYRRLLRAWHPDHNPNPQAGDVFSRIRRLWKLGSVRACTLTRSFQTDSGQTFEARFARLEPFELGEVGFGERHVFWFVRHDARDRFDAAQSALARLRFDHAAMCEQFEPVLPRARFFWGPTGGLMVVEREKGLVRLQTLLAATPDGIGARQVGWLLNALFNLACYLEHVGIAHQAVLPEHLWIHPADHRVALLGGWFYADREGAPLHALPGRALDVAPKAFIGGRQTSGAFDLTLILALGREALGDRSGMALIGRPDVPSSMTAVLRLPAASTAQEQYRLWKQALLTDFGPPTFVPMTISTPLTD